MKTNIFKLSLATLFIISLFGCGGGSSDLGILIPAKDSKNGDYGFMSLDGEIVLDFDLDMKKEPTIMQEGFSIYPVKKNKISTFHFINTKGEVTQTQYSDALLFNEGLALVVERMGKLKYINTKFEDVLILENIQEAGYFSNGLAKFKNNDGKWGFIDQTGGKVIKGQYDYVESFNDGYAMVKVKDPNTRAERRGVINIKGEEIIKLREKYSSLSSFHDGLAAYKENQERGYLNLEGQEVIKNDDWSEVLPFRNGYASIKERGDWGLIDEKGKFVIRPRYKHSLYFVNDLAVVYENREYGYINMKKEEVIDIDFKNTLTQLESLTVKDAIANIEQWASLFMKDETVTTESLIKKLGSSSEINSQRLLDNKKFSYDNNFTFEVTYSFNKRESKSLDATFNAKRGFKLEMYFNKKARAKEMYIISDIVNYLTGEGFNFMIDEDWRKRKNFKMLKDLD